jgi:uncharacterized protein (DUF58 family)
VQLPESVHARRGTSLSPRLLLPLAAAGILTALAAITDDVWLFLLATAALGLGVAGVAVRPRLDGLEYSVDGPTRTTVGATVTHSFHVHNRAHRASAALRLVHQAPGFDDVILAVPALRPGGSARLELPRVARRRVHADAHRTVVTASAPFGLLRATETVDARQLFVVHPAVGRYDVGPPVSSESDDGRPTPARDGTDPGGVRDWRPGETARAVHWRSTARRGRLVIVERERTLAARRAILVCGPAGAPDFESLVSAVATSAVAASRRGERVAVLAAGHDVCDGSTTALLDWCAALRDPGPPDAGTVAAALRWTGGDGQVLIAAPSDWRAECSSLADRHAGRSAGRLALLDTDGRQLDPPGRQLHSTGWQPA